MLDTRTLIGGNDGPVEQNETIETRRHRGRRCAAHGSDGGYLEYDRDGTDVGEFPYGLPVGRLTPPTASNLNFGPGQTVPNLVIVKVGTNGNVKIYNAVGSVHVIFDVAGWYGP